MYSFPQAKFFIATLFQRKAAHASGYFSSLHKCPILFFAGYAPIKVTQMLSSLYCRLVYYFHRCTNNWYYCRGNANFKCHMSLNSPVESSHKCVKTTNAHLINLTNLDFLGCVTFIIGLKHVLWLLSDFFWQEASSGK